MESSADRLKTLDTSLDLCCSKSIKSADCSCCQCIGYHMTSRHRDLYMETLLLTVLCQLAFDADITAHSLKSTAFYIFAGNCTVLAVSEKYRLNTVVFFYSGELIIIAVKHDIFFHILKNLCLGFQNAVSVSKVLQMTGSDVRDHTGIRFRDFCQTGHFPEITDSHFQNCDLIFITKAEHSQRKSQLIVEISLCFEGAVFLFQYRRNDLFCAGFSNASCDSHNRNPQLLQIKFRDILHSLK